MIRSVQRFRCRIDSGFPQEEYSRRNGWCFEHGGQDQPAAGMKSTLSSQKGQGASQGLLVNADFLFLGATAGACAPSAGGGLKRSQNALICSRRHLHIRRQWCKSEFVVLTVPHEGLRTGLP